MIDEEAQLEQLTSAHRERRTTGEILFSPVFYDLEPEARTTAFERTRALRALESALDPDGLSTTAHAVLSRIAGSGAGLTTPR